MNTDNNNYNDIILGRQIPMLRLSVFKERYVPLIFNSDPSLFNMRWIEDVAMNPYLEVDLVDDYGTKVYTVPPLRRLVNSHTDTILNEITKMAAAEASVHTVKGELFLENNLPKLVKFDSGLSDDIRKRWAALLTELGYGEFLETNSVNKSLNSDSGGLEVLDNEDW